MRLVKPTILAQKVTKWTSKGIIEYHNQKFLSYNFPIK